MDKYQVCPPLGKYQSRIKCGVGSQRTFKPFFSTLNAYLNNFWQKIPYSNVLRQKRVSLSLPRLVSYWLTDLLTLAHYDSFCLSLTHSGSNWLSLALCDSHSGSHWLSLPLSGLLWLSLWLSLAHYCSLILLTQSLIGSQASCWL